MITPKAYRQMRAHILDHFCEQLELNAPPILEKCTESTLLHRAHRMYAAGGSPLPESVYSKADLVGRITRVAQLFLVHAIEQRLLWMGDFEEEKARVQAATEQEYERWIASFNSWTSEPGTNP